MFTENHSEIPAPPRMLSKDAVRPQEYRYTSLSKQEKGPKETLFSQLMNLRMSDSSGRTMAQRTLLFTDEWRDDLFPSRHPRCPALSSRQTCKMKIHVEHLDVLKQRHVISDTTHLKDKNETNIDQIRSQITTLAISDAAHLRDRSETNVDQSCSQITTIAISDTTHLKER